MFNWFRRNEKAKQQPEATPSETKPEVTTSETKTEVAEPDYLAFAKAAYKNIQERKGEAEKTTEEVEQAPTSEIVEEPAVETDVSESQAEESLAESTETIEKEVEEPVVESTEVTEVEENCR